MGPDTAVAHLENLAEAVIDTSSIIYASRAGFLEKLSGEITLLTVAGVIEEVGYQVAGITTIAPDEGVARKSVDLRVVEAASRLHLPVISDDRKLLAAAEAEGCLYFNAIMMLEFLLLRRRLTLSSYNAHRQRLIAFARYSRYVLATAQQIHLAVRKRVG